MLSKSRHCGLKLASEDDVPTGSLDKRENEREKNVRTKTPTTKNRGLTSRGCFAQLSALLFGPARMHPARRNVRFRVRVEELESRLAPASIPTLFNTGVDDSGVVLSDASTDAHYSLISVPSGSGLGASAYVAEQNKW